MKPIFGKAPPLGIRLALAVIASMTLILVDGQTSSMTKARSVMETAVGGLYYLANGPRTVLDGVSSNLVDTNKLQIENRVLKEQLREKNADLLLNLLLDEFKELIATFDNYNLGKLKIKFSYDDLNILINKEQIEVSAYKSPHWITMGSAFVLVYNFMTAKFEYKVDHIDLETSLKNQELLLFKKISFKDDLLDSNIKKLYAESLIISEPPKESLLTKIKLFLTKRMK